MTIYSYLLEGFFDRFKKKQAKENSNKKSENKKPETKESLTEDEKSKVKDLQDKIKAAIESISKTKEYKDISECVDINYMNNFKLGDKDSIDIATVFLDSDSIDFDTDEGEDIGKKYINITKKISSKISKYPIYSVMYDGTRMYYYVFLEDL